MIWVKTTAARLVAVPLAAQAAADLSSQPGSLFRRAWRVRGLRREVEAAQCLGMTNFTELPSILPNHLVPSTDPRPHPHMLRHTYVTTMLDAGVDLRDVQIAARHADPRTTMRYDRARKNLDRYPNYILAAYMASGT